MQRQIKLNNLSILRHISIYKNFEDLQQTPRVYIKKDKTLCGIKDIIETSPVYSYMFYNRKNFSHHFKVCKKCINKLK